MTKAVAICYIYISGMPLTQWRIQDFPEEGAPTLHGAPTYDFAKFSEKNCMKLKEFGPPGVRRMRASLKLYPRRASSGASSVSVSSSGKQAPIGMHCDTLKSVPDPLPSVTIDLH